MIGTGFAGKYNFVSPEQLGMFGGDVKGQSDIYSLGLVLVAALRGEPIDMAGSQSDVMKSAATCRISRVSIRRRAFDRPHAGARPGAAHPDHGGSG